MREFEHDGFLKIAIADLVERHKIRGVIETGTEYGGTANALSRMPGVEVVLTIDREIKFNSGDLDPKVQFVIGDSCYWLGKMVELMSEYHPLLIYLDAHTSNAEDDSPLPAELNKLRQVRWPMPPVLVVHDCLVPDRPAFGYDTYRNGPIQLEMVEPALPDIYPNGYTCSYNREAEGNCRGVLFIEPCEKAKCA